MTFRAGAGRAEILLPDTVFPVDGFDGVHDPLHARVLLLDDDGTRTALVSLEQTSVFDHTVAAVRRVVDDVAGVPGERVLVAATHTFSAPHVLPDDRVPPGAQDRNATVATALLGAVRAATTSALATLRPARIGSATGTSSVNVNRDVRTPSGWWLGADEHGHSDHRVPVLRIVAADDAGATIAIVTSLDVQSSVMDRSTTADGRRLVSGDLAGATAAAVESALPDAVLFFLAGCGGDQAPFLTAARQVVDPLSAAIRIDDVHEAGFAIAELLGARLAAEVLRVADGVGDLDDAPTIRVARAVVDTDAQAIPAHFSAIRPSTSYDFVPAGTSTAPVVALRIGDTAIAATQAELTSVIGTAVRDVSPFRTTVVATVVEGAAKYLADEDAYDRITYAAMNSRYARGSAERVARGLGGLLGDLA